MHRMADFCSCGQAEPGNKEVRALLARYKKESAAANKRDAKMFKVHSFLSFITCPLL